MAKPRRSLKGIVLQTCQPALSILVAVIFLLAESKYEVQFYDPMSGDDISIPSKKHRAGFFPGSCHSRFVKTCSTIIHHQQADKCCCNCYRPV